MFSNPAESFATETFIAEPGRYRVQIVSFKCREYKKDEELQSYILAFTLRLTEGENKGTLLQSYDCWLGTPDDKRQDGLNNMMKVVLAACGIEPGVRGADDQFRSQFSHLDLGFNPAENTFNSGWDSIKGQEIEVDLAKNFAKNGNIYQKFNRFFPV